MAEAEIDSNTYSMDMNMNKPWETEGREASQPLVLRYPAWVAGVGDGATQSLPTQDSSTPLKSH